MLTINGINFADSILVLYKIKEKQNHKTLQDTYKYLETEEIGTILDVLLASYNVANKTDLTDEEFGIVLGEHNIGLAKLAFVYKDVIEAIMFSGMSEDELGQLKNLQMNLKSKKK